MLKSFLGDRMHLLEKFGEINDSQYCENVELSTHAKNLMSRLIRNEIKIAEAYDSLQGMKQAVNETPRAC